jgi:hypothetical protein
MDRLKVLSWFYGWWCMAILSWFSDLSGQFRQRTRQRSLLISDALLWRVLRIRVQQVIKIKLKLLSTIRQFWHLGGRWGGWITGARLFVESPASTPVQEDLDFRWFDGQFSLFWASGVLIEQYFIISGDACFEVNTMWITWCVESELSILSADLKSALECYENILNLCFTCQSEYRLDSWNCSRDFKSSQIVEVSPFARCERPPLCTVEYHKTIIC